MDAFRCVQIPWFIQSYTQMNVYTKVNNSSYKCFKTSVTIQVWQDVWDTILKWISNFSVPSILSLNIRMFCYHSDTANALNTTPISLYSRPTSQHEAHWLCSLALCYQWLSMNWMSDRRRRVFGNGRGCGESTVMLCRSMSTFVLEKRVHKEYPQLPINIS